jgi:tetratricopeptide (TPR) repeat protein
MEEALAISREEGYIREIAWNLGTLARALLKAGQREAVEPLLVEAIAVGRQSGDITPVLDSSRSLAQLYSMRGDLASARRTAHEALVLASPRNLKGPISSLLTLGDLASAGQEWESADDWYRQALSAASLLAARGIMAHALRHYAAMCAARGDHRGAVRILGTTSLVHDFKSWSMFNLLVAEADVTAVARQALGEHDFAVAWAEGQSITIEQATADILSGESTPVQR